MYSEAMYVQTNTYLDNLKRDYQPGVCAFDWRDKNEQ